MTAISLYISTCKYVMQAEAADHSSWSDLYRYLPYLRQALACCACGNIIAKPRGPAHGECLHNVCTRCVGRKMKLKPSCSWCKDYEDFRDNTHLRIVVLCFRKLCDYIYSSEIWSELSSSAPNGETNPLVAIVNEALSFEDDYVSSSVMPILPVVMPILTPATIKPVRKRRGSKREQTGDDHSEGSSQDPPTLSPECDTNPFERDDGKATRRSKSREDTAESRPDNDSSPTTDETCAHNIYFNALPIRTRHSSGRQIRGDKQQWEHHVSRMTPTTSSRSRKSQRSTSHDIPFEPPSKRTRASSLPSRDDLTKKFCKCARNNTPNRLTCLGQRCPCYSTRLPCVDCLCRGCRNPRKFGNAESDVDVEGIDDDQENGEQMS